MSDDAPLVSDRRIGRGSGARRIPWLWIAAILALAMAMTLFLVGRSAEPGPGGDVSAVVDDPEGDVVGAAVAEVGPVLDLRRVSLAREDGALTLEFEHQRAILNGALEAEPLTYAAQLRSGNVTYELRASLGPSVAAATVSDTSSIDEPYTLPEPERTPRGLRIEIPKDAIPELADTFAWGVAVRVAASEDVAPSDRSALFPPVEGAGIGPGRSKW